ncbi:MAG: ferredoxin family protein [Armatimonadota bacterium]
MANRCAVVISRQLGDDSSRRALEDELARRCATGGSSVLIIPHLYHLPPGSAVWAEIAATGGSVAFAGWLFPRPARCLLLEHGIEVAATIDLASCASAQEALEALHIGTRQAQEDGSVREVAAPVAERWYPVIDRSRCIGCGHCVGFCLFGVYQTDESGQAVVIRPDNCKPGCPACSRICPGGAIIFPLSDEPAIAGAPGTFMSPDAAARRMFYLSTGQPCPVCGGTAHAGELTGVQAGTLTCAECGRPLAGNGVAVPSVVHDEIDALIDALDELAGSDGA